MYRLSEKERNYEFFRSNTLDFISFGFSKFKQGSHIGLPPSYFANSKSDLTKLIPTCGFEYFIGKNIPIDDINKKMTYENREKLFDSMILSKDAKLFGLAREVVVTENFIHSTLDRIVELISMSLAYIYSYAKTRAYKMQFFQRRRIYFFSGLSALIVIFVSKFFINKSIQRIIDFQACQMGLDCCIGSVEFYEKNLERNKLLREVINDGHKLIDSNGNILKQPVYLPLTNYYFYINYMGIKLTDRKEFCKNQLDEMLKKLDQKMEENEKKTQELATTTVNDSTKPQDDNNGLKIFKILKIKFESFGKQN